MAIVDIVQGENLIPDDSSRMSEEPYLIPSVVIGFLICMFFMVLLFKNNVFSPAAASGIFVPFSALFVCDPTMLQMFALGAAGFTAGLVISLVQRRIRSKKGRYAAYRIEPGDGDDDSTTGGISISIGGISIGGSSGGSSGSGSSGGGSSGGGGSFGGGGASGGW